MTVVSVADVLALPVVQAGERKLAVSAHKVQSILICLAGCLLGVPATFGVNWLAERVVPEFSNIVRWEDVAIVLGMALVMGIVASFIPIRRVASVDPASVFRT